MTRPNQGLLTGRRENLGTRLCCIAKFVGKLGMTVRYKVAESSQHRGEVGNCKLQDIVLVVNFGSTERHIFV